jgi:hypothetical protein
MTLLRVVPFKLFTRLTDLLNHDVFRVPLNDALDGGAFVSGDDNEAESLLDDSLVLARRDRKLLDAGSVDALTVKRQRSFDAVLLRPFVDPLVDPPEDLFVARSSLCELHPTMIARLRVDRPFNARSYTGAARGTSRSSEGGRG